MTSFVKTASEIKGIDVIPPIQNWEAKAYGLPPARTHALRNAGFNTLRMWPRLSSFLNSEAGRTRATRRLLDQAHRAADAGFKTIFCFGGTWEQQYKMLDGGQGTAQLLDAAGALAAGIAAEFLPELVAIEFLNEPPSDGTLAERGLAAYTSKYAPTIARTIQDAAPKLTVIVQSGRGWSENIDRFDPNAFSENTLFAFHFYEPSLFTHQAATYYHIDRVPFPARFATESAEEMIERASERIDQDKSLSADKRQSLKEWYEKNVPYTLADRGENGERWFSWPRLDAWIEKHNMPRHRILCTEFGANGDVNFTKGKGADEASRARWIRAARLSFEAAGFGGWVVHQALGDFNIIQQQTVKIQGNEVLGWVPHALFE